MRYKILTLHNLLLAKDLVRKNIQTCRRCKLDLDHLLRTKPRPFLPNGNEVFLRRRWSFLGDSLEVVVGGHDSSRILSSLHRL